MSVRSLRAVTLLAGRAHSLLMEAAESFQALVSTDIRQAAEQKAVLVAITLQCVRTLGLAPEKVFPDLIQAVEARIRAELDHRTVRTIATQASPAEHLPLQLHILPAKNQ